MTLQHPGSSGLYLPLPEGHTQGPALLLSSVLYTQAEGWTGSSYFPSPRLHTCCQDCRVLEVQTHTPLVMPTTRSMDTLTMKTSTAGIEVVIRQSGVLDEGSADDQVASQRDQHKASQSIDIHAAHVTHTSELIPCHPAHHQDQDGLHSRDGPGCQVKVAAVGFNGLVAPLLAGCQEPSEGDALSASKESNDIAHRIDAVAHGEEDDGTFGVLEARWVNEEALEPGLLTHDPASGDGRGDLLSTHGRIQRAQEEAEVAVAAVLHERRKLVQLNSRLTLVLVAHQVGHAGGVVADVLTHGNLHWLTLAVSRALQVHGADGCARAHHHLQHQPQARARVLHGGARGIPAPLRAAAPGHGLLLLLPVAPRPGSGPRACPSSLARALAAPGAPAVSARPRPSPGRRGRGAKFANNTAERAQLSAQTLASSSGRARSGTAMGKRGRTVVPSSGAPPSRPRQLFLSGRPGMRRLARSKEGGKGEKSRLVTGPAPARRPPPRPAPALLCIRKPCAPGSLRPQPRLRAGPQPPASPPAGLSACALYPGWGAPRDYPRYPKDAEVTGSLDTGGDPGSAPWEPTSILGCLRVLGCGTCRRLLTLDKWRLGWCPTLWTTPPPHLGRRLKCFGKYQDLQCGLPQLHRDS
ncbi:uncharacterized protein [Alexandromys fortis]|uniref:uncharacterized protein n=1 Tax=Alexandromys fortis TaxID=100897 RepID=UPI002152D823|nr:uncharacterized protein LOC126504335 [Microtus fortis]